MQEMTASSPHELAALRARAYGPRADIDDDPAALARLRELEAAERAALRERETECEAQDADVDGPRGSAAPPAEWAERDAVDELRALEASAAPPAPRPIAPAWIIAWAASVLVVALVVGGLVFGLASIRPVSTATGATQVASLTDPADMSDMEWVRQWFGGSQDMSGYVYLGLIVARTPQGVFAEGSDCLLVLRSDGFQEDDQSFRGPVYSGCRAGAFPAAVQFVVGADAPKELRDRFGDGTALSFVLDEDVVGVFASEAPSPTPTVIAVD